MLSYTAFLFLLCFSLCTYFFIIRKCVACPTAGSRRSVSLGDILSAHYQTKKLISSGEYVVSLTASTVPVGIFTHE